MAEYSVLWNPFVNPLLKYPNSDLHHKQSNVFYYFRVEREGKVLLVNSFTGVDIVHALHRYCG